MSKLVNTDYQQILQGLKEKIRQARLRTSLKVNAELLRIYWEIGDTILQQQIIGGWGAKIIKKLVSDLKSEFPDFKGISVRNLSYMRAFAVAYPDFLENAKIHFKAIENNENQGNKLLQAQLAPLKSDFQDPFVQAGLAQISWYHHITLLDKIKDKGTRIFYMQKALENGWTRDEMVLQIGTKLHERQGKAITNFSETLPGKFAEYAAQTLKSPYVIDFLSITEEMKERDIEQGLIQHLKKFMQELGRGFAYVGNQKNINIAGDDFFLDLLFFNYNLNCFVLFELKIGDFKPEFAGKLNFYVNAVNEQMKGPHHSPTIGILLCKTPNETVVKYSLHGIESPIGVADYKLVKALPKTLKGEIPSIEELENEIEREYEELKSPSQKRFDSLKQKLSSLKGDEIKQTATTDILFRIFDKSLLPLYESIIQRMKQFKELFVSSNYYWYAKNIAITNIEELAAHWKNEEFLKSSFDFPFSYHLNGFKKAGTEAFSVAFQLNYRIDVYWYGFILVNHNSQQPFLKKLYHEQLTTEDIEHITETVYDAIMDQIEHNIERL